MPDASPAVFEPVDPDNPTPVVPRWPHMTREQAIAVLFPEIERRMADGETLTEVCSLEERFEPDGRRVRLPRLPGTFPHRTTVYEWCEDAAVARRFARARALCIEAWDDQSIAIADDATADWIPGERGLIYNGEAVQRSKLRIWARQQLIRRCPGHRPSDVAAANGVPKVAPPKVEVIGVIPRGQEAQYGAGAPIEGVAVRIDDDDEGEDE